MLQTTNSLARWWKQRRSYIRKSKYCRIYLRDHFFLFKKSGECGNLEKILVVRESV